jgi:LmbE family N-acetylglucosaminyl deacetylase
MLRLKSALTSSVSRVLCLGAHCDDIEIGSAGLLMTLIEANPRIEMHWHVFGGTDERMEETRHAAQEVLRGAARVRIDCSRHRNSFFPAAYAELKEDMERIKHEAQPDLVLVHCRDDLHQDHRAVNELAWNAFRDHLLLEYEIPKYDGDLGRPNFYVPLEETMVRRKLDTLMEWFPSQRQRRWFTRDLFQGLMRLRGMECNAPSGHAEAFHVRKLSL